MTVWKYAFPAQDHVTFAMPEGAEPIHVDAVGDDLCIWALVNETLPKEDRHFAVVGTGHAAPELAWGRHIGSCLQRGGRLVWHVFEVTA